MNGRYLLDTNVIIALFADEAGVKEYLAKADEVFVPSIAVGELYFGARKSGRGKENLRRIDEFVAAAVVLGCDSETGRRYGETKAALQVKGRPIPENDVWIAAIALQHRLVLVTRDTHFDQVEDLETTAW